MLLPHPLATDDFVAAACACCWRSVEEATDRVVSSVCGLTVGIGLVCLVVSCLDWLEGRDLQEASSSRALRAEASPPLLDLLANRLVRKNSKLIHEAYTFHSGPPLGVGAFGVVLRASHKGTGIERAVKKIDKSLVGEGISFTSEVEALRALDSPHVCRLLEFFETSRHLWLVTELCRGEELCSRLLEMPGGISEAEAACWMRQMLLATLHCHRRSVVHRDLKPENFVVARGKAGDVLKLIDFGSSVQLSDSAGPAGRAARAPAHALSPQGSGTLLYMSPQMLQGESACRADDVWSLGVIFHILLTGRFPFSTNDDDRFLGLCAQGLLSRDVEDQLRSLQSSPAARDLAARLLAFDPDKRITAQAALQHPFLRGAHEAKTERLGAVELCEHCERFAETCRLRRLALAVSARLAEASWADAERVRSTFLALDSGDGSIDAADLLTFLSSAGLRVSAQWLTRLLRDSQVLSEPNGQAMSYTSFAATIFEDAAVSGRDRVCRAVFDLLDADHDGVVSAEDLRRRLDLSLQESDEMIVDALSDIGLDSQQRSGIDVRGFLQLMRPQPRSAPQPA